MEGLQITIMAEDDKQAVAIAKALLELLEG